ncbi:PhoD-like phosphatase [Dietzia kunjamensis]|uniref:alkaline phosphatase D family protein n=1 Tax=Dietzia kunjamensis TaxID=322509 RepID=UPI000E734E51|nr:alkaline phosphatase D family protein [Dietzia kunjamensis]MBB1013407.1 alkaline phosphatase family protein [Dietzia kunjamensis]RKE59661.1 PhoD-like phosphatase [Dietzia kunjamensis]
MTLPPEILVGPMLRYVDSTDATVWVEVSAPCEVTIRAGDEVVTERSWGVHGHHFAVLHLCRLPEGEMTPYEVSLDDRLAWPVDPGRPSVIRTPRADDTVRLAFGSCRRGESQTSVALRRIGADALVALAHRMARTPQEEWPDAMLLLGDQVYADIPSREISERLAERRRAGGGPQSVRDSAGAGGDRDVSDEICDFEEYSWLYQESWRDADVRWLLSTVPSCMILDDHDLRDDWNSSHAWRREMTAQPWWSDRVIGAFGSYFVYQHLGNLAPDELERNEMYRALRSAGSDAERESLLDDFALSTDSERRTEQWSFKRDFGRVRVVMLDVRASRHLDPQDRRVMDANEWQWTRESCLDADVDHLVIGSSLPAFMLPALHNLEGWNEAVSRDRPGKPATARVGEWIRLAVDLEHWAAFRNSFDDLVGLLTEVAAGDHGPAPASILLLGGDVHCSYLEEIDLTAERVADSPTRVHQLVMSPFRNPLQKSIRAVNRLSVREPVPALTRRLARAVGVREPEARWRVTDGLWFDNGVMTLVLRGRRATVQVDHATVEWPARGLGKALTLVPGLAPESWGRRRRREGDSLGRKPRQVLRRTLSKELTGEGLSPRGSADRTDADRDGALRGGAGPSGAVRTEAAR